MVTCRKGIPGIVHTFMGMYLPSTVCWRVQQPGPELYVPAVQKVRKKQEIHDVKTGTGKCCRLENYYMVPIGI
jgi:hypothetical protein